jgi:transposase
LRERPRSYRKVVELLAEPGMSINQITKLCRVSEHTVRALRDREAISIAERKQRLMSIFANVAEISAERMEELHRIQNKSARFQWCSMLCAEVSRIRFQAE